MFRQTETSVRACRELADDLSRISIGQCLFDTETELLCNCSDELIHLRNQSFSALLLLGENYGLLICREYIFSVLWEKRLITDDSLTQCIKEIWQAIGDVERKILATVHRRG